MNWYDYGARMYDPQLGRWHSIDRKAEKYKFLTPYAYVNNNPLIYFDPNGTEGVLVLIFDARITAGWRTAGVATGFMFDFKAGQASVFFSPSVGIGTGGGAIWGLNIGYYPKATIEKYKDLALMQVLLLRENCQASQSG